MSGQVQQTLNCTFHLFIVPKHARCSLLPLHMALTLILHLRRESVDLKARRRRHSPSLLTRRTPRDVTVAVRSYKAAYRTQTVSVQYFSVYVVLPVRITAVLAFFDSQSINNLLLQVRITITGVCCLFVFLRFL